MTPVQAIWVLLAWPNYYAARGHEGAGTSVTRMVSNVDANEACLIGYRLAWLRGACRMVVVVDRGADYVTVVEDRINLHLQALPEGKEYSDKIPEMIKERTWRR